MQLFAPERKVIIIEGTNYAGKTSILQGLGRKFPGSTVIEHHGFYRIPALRISPFPAAPDAHPYLLLQPEDKKEIRKNQLRRLHNTVRKIEEDKYDSFLVERFHISDYSYLRYLGEDVDFGDYSGCEQELNWLGAYIFSLTLDDETLRERGERTVKKERISGKGSELVSPAFFSYDNSRKRRDLYLEAHGLSKVERKFLIDTSGRTPEESLGLILEKLL